MRSRRSLLVSVLLLALLAAFVAWMAWGGGAPKPAAQATAHPAGPATSATAGNGPEVGTGSTAPSPAAQRMALADRTPGVAGRLLQGDRPLADVEVRAVDNGGKPREAGVVATAADGSFFVPLAAGSYRLELRGAGVPRAFALEPIPLATGEHRELGDVPVPAGAAVEGRVVDESGQPVAGARVFARSSENRFRTREFRLEVVDPAAADADPNMLTGTDGRFAIGGLLPGDVEVLAEHEDLQHWTVDIPVGPGERGDVGDLVLRAAAPLRGFVTDEDGVGLAGARVTPGGGSDPLHPRQRAVTAADGGFVLRGFGERSDFTVELPGFETRTCHRIDPEEAQPLRVVMTRALQLAGKVVGGHGDGGRVQVTADAESHTRWPWWVEEILQAPHPLAADGSFCVRGLPAGTWMVGAHVPGAGSAAPVRCELPQQTPLELRLVADLAVAVRVVDDRGQPLPGALLVRTPGAEPTLLFAPRRYATFVPAWPDGIEQRAGADGTATVQLSQDDALMLLGRAPGHLDNHLVCAQGQVPATATLTLNRAGFVRGTFADRDLPTHTLVRIDCARTDAADQPAASMQVDARGGFHSRELAPGRYTLTLDLVDSTRYPGHGLPLPAELPLLLDDGPVGSAVPIEVQAGETSEVTMPSTTIGELQGRVLAGGAGVAGAIVFARNAAERRRHGDDDRRDDLDAGDAYPRCRTDAAGRFRFLVGVRGTWELRARHPLGARWSEPLTVALAPDARVQRDIVLPAAAIRGSFDPSVAAPADREFLTAQLYPLQQATADPFFFSEWTSSIEFAVQRVPLGRTGRFAFECLQPGTWVLRLVGRHDDILLTRVLQTVGDQALELGPLAPEHRVAPALACGLQSGFGIVVRLAADGGADGVFVRTVVRDQTGAMAWGVLAPGRYRLQAFRRAGMDLNTFGEHGEAVDEPIEVELRADGSCTPASVWPSGLTAAPTGGR